MNLTLHRRCNCRGGHAEEYFEEEGIGEWLPLVQVRGGYIYYTPNIPWQQEACDCWVWNGCGTLWL